MREMVFGLDADFSEEAFVGRLNADLANDLGNLVSRATTLLAKATPNEKPEFGFVAADQDVRVSAGEARHTVELAMEEFAFHRALGDIWEFIGVLNRYIDTTQPWALAKDSTKAAELNRVLATLADTLRFLGIVLAPFLPDAAAKIRRAIGDDRKPELENAVVGRNNTIPRVERLSGLFPRVDEKTPAAAPAESARIRASDFAKLDLRVAEVVAAEPVPRSKKLLRLTVSLGTEERTVVAGIAEHYAPGDLVGKKIVIVANLEPARLMGVDSNGMLLAGSAGDRLAVLTLDRDLPPGARVK